MATESKWVIEAVGTENGRSVVFVRNEAGNSMPNTMVVPTSALVMSKLAASGCRVWNRNEPRATRTGV